MAHADYQLISQAWDDFEKTVLRDPGISAIQRAETRKAFYAGAGSMFAMVGSFANLPEDKAVKAMERIDVEIAAYAAELVIFASLERKPR